LQCVQHPFHNIQKRIVRIMTRVTPLCHILYARDSKAVELVPTVGTQ